MLRRNRIRLFIFSSFIFFFTLNAFSINTLNSFTAFCIIIAQSTRFYMFRCVYSLLALLKLRVTRIVPSHPLLSLSLLYCEFANMCVFMCRIVTQREIHPFLLGRIVLCEGGRRGKGMNVCCEPTLRSCSAKGLEYTQATRVEEEGCGSASGSLFLRPDKGCG